jgi:hypothetical protein
MSYDYQTERPFVFTEDGQVMFLKIRDTAKSLLEKSGAVSCGRLIAGLTGDSWGMLACVDRLVELRELREVPNPHSSAGQHRLFIAGSL